MREGVHINTVESLWASLKRISYGIHHWSFKPMQRSINRVLFRINRISEAERPMTAWDRINELLGQCLTARTTYKQRVKGEAKGIGLIQVYNFHFLFLTADHQQGANHEETTLHQQTR